MPVHRTHFKPPLIVPAFCLMPCAVPLIVLPQIYDSAILPKLLAFHLCLALACLGWLIQTGWGRNVRVASSPLFLPALCLMGVSLLSAPATPRPLDALVELLNLAALLVLCFIAASALTVRAIQPILWASALAGLAVALIGILQYHGLAFLGIPSAAPPSATFLNRNPAAEYLIGAIPLSALLFLTAEGRVKLAISGLSTSLMGVYLVYTRTRAAWGGVLCGLAGVGIALTACPDLRGNILRAMRSRWNPRRRSWGVGLLILFGVLSVLPADQTALREKGLPYLSGEKAGLSSTVASIFKPDVTEDLSVKQRLAFWRNSLRMVADHPLLGVGPGGWTHTYPPYDRGATLTQDSQPRNPHNDYIWIAAEYGLLGLAAYLWFLLTGFRCLLRMAGNQDPFLRIAAVMFSLSLLSLLVAALFGFPREQAQTALFPYLLFGIAAGATAGEREKHALSKVEGEKACPEQGRRGKREKKPLSPFSFLLFPYLLLALSLGAVEVDRRRIGFDRHYLNAIIQIQPPTDWRAALSEVDRALEYGAFRPHTFYLRGVVLETLGRTPEATDAYRESLARSPHAWYVYERLGLIYARQGRLEDALTHCRTALSILDYAQARNSLGFVLNKKGDGDGALREWRRAVQIAPDFVEAHSNLGAALYARGDIDSAIAHYRQAIQIKPDYAEVLCNLGIALRARGDLDDAIRHYRQALQINPGYARAHLNLGDTLAEGGDRAGAIAAFRACLPLIADDRTKEKVRDAILRLGGAP